MGYAPISTIDTAPTPADSGTIVIVTEDTGDRYPVPPFLALVWPSQTIPQIGVNAEEPTVVSIEGDVLTVVRGTEPVEWTSGLQLSALRTIDSYSIGDTISLVQEFPSTDTGVTLSLRTPNGAIETQPLVDVSGDPGYLSYSTSFEGTASGRWHYAFASDQRTEPEQDFYVRFSDVY